MSIIQLRTEKSHGCTGLHGVARGRVMTFGMAMRRERGVLDSALLYARGRRQMSASAVSLKVASKEGPCSSTYVQRGEQERKAHFAIT